VPRLLFRLNRNRLPPHLRGTIRSSVDQGSSARRARLGRPFNRAREFSSARRRSVDERANHNPPKVGPGGPGVSVGLRLLWPLRAGIRPGDQGHHLLEILTGGVQGTSRIWKRCLIPAGGQSGTTMVFGSLRGCILSWPLYCRLYSSARLRPLPVGSGLMPNRRVFGGSQIGLNGCPQDASRADGHAPSSQPVNNV